MKTRLILGAVLGLGLAGVGFGGESSSGCGLGWQVTKAYTTLASSTRSSVNATFSSTFGMTSGTSGCAKHSIVKQERLQRHFMEANQQRIRIDIALGGGEFAQGMVRTFGCSDTVSLVAVKSLQARYGEIYGDTAEVDVGLTIAKIRETLLTQPQIASQCRFVG